MVVIMQQLTTRGILLKRQMLTAAHDESTAWTGLGSALLVLWRQTRIAASVLGTLLITVYLIGIAVLHVSTPSLFGLQVFERPDGTNISTTIGMPVITGDIPVYGTPSLPFLYLTISFPSIEPFATSFWSGFASYLSADIGSMIGIQNGTLYDVLDDNNGTGNVAVGANSFNVTCGYIPNTTVAGTRSKSRTTWQAIMNYNGIESNVSLGLTGEEVILPATHHVTVFLEAPNVLGHVRNMSYELWAEGAPFPLNAYNGQLVRNQQYKADSNISLIVSNLGSQYDLLRHRTRQYHGLPWQR
jgi:hypothetical protein